MYAHASGSGSNGGGNGGGGGGSGDGARAEDKFVGSVDLGDVAVLMMRLAMKVTGLSTARHAAQ